MINNFFLCHRKKKHVSFLFHVSYYFFTSITYQFLRQNGRAMVAFTRKSTGKNLFIEIFAVLTPKMRSDSCSTAHVHQQHWQNLFFISLGWRKFISILIWLNIYVHLKMSNWVWNSYYKSCRALKRYRCCGWLDGLQINYSN